mgnify:CR=1 FL=1
MDMDMDTEKHIKTLKTINTLIKKYNKIFKSIKTVKQKSIYDKIIKDNEL